MFVDKQHLLSNRQLPLWRLPCVTRELLPWLTLKLYYHTQIHGHTSSADNRQTWIIVCCSCNITFADDRIWGSGQNSTFTASHINISSQTKSTKQVPFLTYMYQVHCISTMYTPSVMNLATRLCTHLAGNERKHLRNFEPSYSSGNAILMPYSNCINVCIALSPRALHYRPSAIM